MSVSLRDNIALNLHVHHHKISTIEAICHDAAHESGCKHNSIRLFFIKELLYRILVGQIQLFMRAAHQIIITSRFEVIPDSRTHKSIVSSYINLTVLIHISVIQHSIQNYSLFQYLPQSADDQPAPQSW